MKKRLSSILSLILVAALALSFGGCKKEAETNTVEFAQINDFLVAEKVGTLDIDVFTTTSGGLYYKGDDGLYGVMSLEGTYDTGAKYVSCRDVKSHFIVAEKMAVDYNDVAGLNSFGLINGKGRVVVPFQYADYYFISDRFVQVFEATERTYVDDDDAVIQYGSYEKVTLAAEQEALYKGKWYVYDVTTGKQVPGLTDTKEAGYILAEGGVITCKFGGSDERIIVDADGNLLPEGANVLEDGSYTVEGKTGEMYDDKHNLLFSYDLSGFIPKTANGDGSYVATKNVDGSTKSVVMDKTGNVISAEFNSNIVCYGSVILMDNKVYNLEGNNIVEGTYDLVYYDKIIGNHWILKNDSGYTMIDKNGAIYFTGGDGKDTTVFTNEFTASKKIDDKTMYYSHKDKDYTISGYAFAPWVVKVESANYRYDLVDTMTGEKLLEGYQSYSYTARNPMAYYVYAKYEGGTDVYLIVANSRLSDVTQRKGALLDDMIVAFEQEGIAVIVNKEDGTITLDTGVLFGGDSAVLSDEGKVFLNKFIKAYTNVAFSEKYAGFISKTIVEGHTAPVEGSTYASGLPLSEERANNVMNYCLSADTGVDVSAIMNTMEAVGYSNSQPVYDANGNVDLAASRRVTFRFLVAVDM
ncbi:MAG: OmpA family protein [Clostridia bacterium]|nr:OmpA family protein [Clostridia bacterium]